MSLRDIYSNRLVDGLKIDALPSAPTPADAGKVLKVNTGGTAIEYGTGGSGSGVRSFTAVVGFADADYTCDGTDDDIQIQAAIDDVAAAGGGTVFLQSATFNTTSAIIPNSTVKIEGQGIDTTFINCTSGNAFELNTTGQKIWMEGLTVKTTELAQYKGIGVYITADLVVDFDLYRVKFETTLNSIYYVNNQLGAGNGLGNIRIEECEFPKGSTNGDGTHYLLGVYHKVCLWDHKTEDKLLEINHNKFIQDATQRSSVVELAIKGNSTSGLGTSSTAIIGGNVTYNKFDGSTRECMQISDHSKLRIIGNEQRNSSRIGFYYTRGYRSVISGNICNGSAYRGHRIDYCSECIWSNNIAVETGLTDSNSVSCGGMTIKASQNNIIVGNTIKALKDSAIVIEDEAGVYSTGNYIAYNKTLGTYSGFYNTDTVNNTNNTIIQPDEYGLEYSPETDISGVDHLTVNKVAKTITNGISPKNLSLYLPFIEDTGTIHDYSGNGVAITSNGSITRNAGIFGNSINFGGSISNYLSLNLPMSALDATISCAIEPTTISAADINTIMECSYSSGRWYYFSLTDVGGTSVYVTPRFYTGATLHTFFTGTEIYLDTTGINRLYIVFTTSGGSTTCKVYNNGVLQGTETIAALASTTSSIIQIGDSTATNSAANLHWLKIWSRALSEQEIWEDTFSPNILAQLSTGATGIFNQHYRQVRAATTANITIATALNDGDTLDGLTLATGDMILVKDQTTASENGIYIVAASPARDPSYSSDLAIRSSKVLVREGTANANFIYANTNTSAITVGSTSITYQRAVRETITADRTITVKAAGGDFTTPYLARDYLAPFEIAANATVTIEIDDGTWTMATEFSQTHPNGDRIKYVGKNTYTKTMSSIQSSSGSAGAWAIIINLDSVTNIAVDDYIIIRSTSGGTRPFLMIGCWKVTNVDTGNSRITVTTTTQYASAPSGNVAGTVYVVKTMLSFTDTTGFSFTGTKIGLIDKMVLVGTAVGASYGVYANVGASVYINLSSSAVFGISGFNTGIVSSGFSYIVSRYSAISNCGTGTLANIGSTLNASNTVVSGCTNGWSSTSGGIIYANTNLTFSVGNTTTGFKAEGGSNMWIGSSRSAYNVSYGYDCESGSIMSADSSTSTTNGTNDYYANHQGRISAVSAAGGTSCSPTANTIGNDNSYIDT